ncbi:hypothetical protein DFJ58DRAFT_849987 [Suillus subalutaceus]|uniref:uncharacterized protein n=1 Tax=Suillus subalutaceus TaxID=48586 RepID=UPI001B85DC9C|nr:uncharacterized protein DFJ58DRAFT_849987 [Suillus subalutaceus]KAG1821440.1 hypothetical protein DFJ58DRAFT_849987 [Suillus subalutaceus]
MDELKHKNIRWFSRFPEHLNCWKPTGNLPHEGEAPVHQNDDNGVVNSDERGLLPLTSEQEAELEEAHEIQQKKLKEWFRNNAKSKTTPSNMSTSKAFAQLLGQCTRGVRNLKDVEVYSKTYYKTKVQPLVKDEVQENKLDAKKRIAVVQKHTTNCFVAESEEVKAEIREETMQINTSRKLGIVSDERTKEEIYLAIQELPVVLGQICEDLAKLMGGWHYTLIMGGPDPMCKGDIMTLSFHHGKGQDGLSFKTSTRIFKSSTSCHLKTPLNFASLHAQNDYDSEELHIPMPVPAESLLDPNFSVSEANIDVFLNSIRPQPDVRPNGQWWHSQGQDMQMAAPPVITPPPAPPVMNPPPVMAGSLIQSSMQGLNNLVVGNSSTPPRIRRPYLNPVPSSLSKSPQLPPVDTPHMASNEGDTLPVTPVSQLTAAADVGNASATANATLSPVLEHSTPAAASSDRLPLVSSVPGAGSVPAFSAPGRRSARSTRPSTRAKDANKIGNDARAITSKCKRKGATVGSTAVTAKIIATLINVTLCWEDFGLEDRKSNDRSRLDTATC